MKTYTRTVLILAVAAVLAACGSPSNSCPAPPPRASFETTMVCMYLYDLPFSNLRRYGDLPTPDSDVLAALEALIDSDNPDRPGVDKGVADAWRQAAAEAGPLHEAFATDSEPTDPDVLFKLIRKLDAACERAGVTMRPGG